MIKNELILIRFRKSVYGLCAEKHFKSNEFDTKQLFVFPTGLFV